jgi:hypothetical protein
MGKIVRAGAGAGIFDKLEPEREPELEPDKNGLAPKHCVCGHAGIFHTWWVLFINSNFGMVEHGFRVTKVSFC